LLRKFLFYWLNRRSQRKSYTGDGFKEFMKTRPLVAPKIYVSIYTSYRNAEALVKQLCQALLNVGSSDYYHSGRDVREKGLLVV